MLDPGKTDSEIVRFIAFLSCVIAGVDEYQELIRASVASAGNDCRLGGNEAPPAIISIYLGDALSNIINAVMKGHSYEVLTDSKMDLGVSVLPQIMRDSSDRNRTSPFAFTANKFEFRMPGSQMNLSDCVMVLNTAIAKSLNDFNKLLEKGNRKLSNPKKFQNFVLSCCAKTLKDHERIIFNGDGYSDEWEKEAKKRGLSNNVTTADALPCMISKSSVDLFEAFGVLTEEELKSRYVISLEKYNKLINIESRLMHRMVKRTFLPAINEYAAELSSQINEVVKANGNSKLRNQKSSLKVLLGGIEYIYACLEKLDDMRELAKTLIDEQKKADHNAKKLVPAMKDLRQSIDNMEHIVPRDYWPVPSYNSMLFYV